MKIHTQPDQLGGVWSNAAAVRHSPHEFTIDFLRCEFNEEGKVSSGILVQRVNMSPLFVTQLIQALQDNWSKYATKAMPPELMSEFVVRHPDGPDGPPEVWTSTGDYCLPGITRRNVLQLCQRHGLTARERNFSLTEVYAASEAFVTGTFAGIAPVTEVDGRTIGDGGRGPVVERLQHWYLDLLDETAEAAP